MHPVSINTKIPVGIRVFAYGARTSNTINVYGQGIYTGVATRDDGTQDHRIVLDSGVVVWGSEVNWVNSAWERTATARRRQIQTPAPAALLSA